MVHAEAFEEFRAGIAYLRADSPTKALARLRRALEYQPVNPFYMSYVGVAVGAAERKWAEAEKLCQSALRINRRHAQLYLNLAEVYASADRKQDAADILSRGLRYTPHDLRLKMALDRLAMRRPPVLVFLPRQHGINRNLGRLRHQALQALSSI